MKNELIKFNLRPRIYRGHKCFYLTWRAGVLAGQPHLAFDLFTEDLIDNGKSNNTIRNQSLQIAQYLDYLEVGYIVYGERSTITTNSLTRDYYNYLTWGANSHSIEIREIYKLKPHNIVSSGTAVTYHAPIATLVKSCNDYIDKAMDNKVYGITKNTEECIALLSNFKRANQNLSNRQKRKMVQNSRVGSLISGGPKTKPINLFSHLPKPFAKKEDVIDQKKYFPLEHISSLILSAPTYRDKALWACAAATGLRPMESLQILMNDIDFKNRKINAVAPKERPNIPHSYQGLSQIEFSQLSWKGRAIKSTLLLEPYGSMFFHALEKYLLFEYQPDAGHNFLFQASNGSPLCLRSYQSAVTRPFRAAVRKILETIDMSERTRLGLHSLRHSYCVYFYNFFRHTRGYGLTEHELMMLTGHTDPASLRKYAVIDRELLEEKILCGRNHFNHKAPRSEQEFLIGFHEERIKELKTEISKWKTKND